MNMKNCKLRYISHTSTSPFNLLSSLCIYYEAVDIENKLHNGYSINIKRLNKAFRFGTLLDLKKQ